MKCYIVFEAVRRKNLTVAKLQDLTNSQKTITAFIDKNRARNHAKSMSEEMSDGNKIYILCAKVNETQVKKEFEIIGPCLGAYRIFPAKREIIVQNELAEEEFEIVSDIENSDDIEIESESEVESDIESEVESDNGLEDDSINEEEPTSSKKKKNKNKNHKNNNKEVKNNDPIWTKVLLGALVSAVFGSSLFLCNAISASTVASFATANGISLTLANIFVFGAAGVVAAGILAAAYFTFQMLDSSLLSEENLNKDTYSQAIKEESKAVVKLKKVLRKQKRITLCDTLDVLENKAKLRKFNKAGEPLNPKKQPKLDKLVVLQWERKKLDELCDMNKKKDIKKFERKILKKVQTKFSA